MPREKTSVRKVQAILRLGLKEGSVRRQREIAQSTGVSKTTVQEVLGKTRAAGMAGRFHWTTQGHLSLSSVSSN
jgi:transposase